MSKLMGHLLSDKFAFIENEYILGYFSFYTQEWLLNQKTWKIACYIAVIQFYLILC